jgi:hypothetical protein
MPRRIRVGWYVLCGTAVVPACFAPEFGAPQGQSPAVSAPMCPTAASFAAPSNPGYGTVVVCDGGDDDCGCQDDAAAPSD